MDETQQAALAALGSKATYGGVLSALGAWFVSSGLGVVCSLLIAILGLLVNWYYKAKQDRRAQREHEKRMAEK